MNNPIKTKENTYQALVFDTTRQEQSYQSSHDHQIIRFDPVDDMDPGVETCTDETCRHRRENDTDNYRVN